MKAQSRNTLRHLAELISQNKNLEEENLKLHMQIEELTSEIENTGVLFQNTILRKRMKQIRKSRIPMS